MATKKERPTEVYEGHGDNTSAPSVKKGTYMQVGTVVELSTRTFSANDKTGTSSGGEQ